ASTVEERIFCATEDLLGAMNRCTKLNQYVDVLLGLNLKESIQIARALELPVADEPEAAIETTARAIREKLDLHGVVIHPRRGAAAAIRTEGEVESASFAGPFVARPRLSTGAGDNFNAGFCVGRLAGLSVAESLCVGTATSGYYVRNAESPSIEQLADFCDCLPQPEGA
ncbi:MAG: PfkB family carbohydrate kinase, partial [Phycisphaeraceae bacterium]